MPKDVIMTQLVHMLSSGNNQSQSTVAHILSRFAQYGELEFAWKPLSFDGCLEDM